MALAAQPDPDAPIYYLQSDVAGWLLRMGWEKPDADYDLVFKKVRVWQSRGKLPQPDARLARGKPLWLEATLGRHDWKAMYDSA
jgi:hypothetical protein